MNRRKFFSLALVSPIVPFIAPQFINRLTKTRESRALKLEVIQDLIERHLKGNKEFELHKIDGQGVFELRGASGGVVGGYVGYLTPKFKVKFDGWPSSKNYKMTYFAFELPLLFVEVTSVGKIVDEAVLAFRASRNMESDYKV